jgi:hypothetical protein
MPYFTNFPTVDYKFGHEDFTVKFPNLISYSDIVDSLKLNGTSYESYYIRDGERPDTVSQKLYKNPQFHWTFFLLNDNLREQGWPLEQGPLVDKISRDHPNTVLTTRTEIFTRFKVGSTVTGQTSSATGTVLRRNLDLGQIYVSGTGGFLGTEAIVTEEDGVTSFVDLVSASAETLAVHHYTNGTRNVDIDPFVGPGSGITPVTYTEYYFTQNDSLKQIRVFSPDVVTQVAREFRRVMDT